ncbi:MAG: replication protein [Omnitrophica bacterium]|nr:replication protein [Candidatus Omnitrophota bacterium]
MQLDDRKKRTVRIPTEIWEALTKVRISGEEWQCLCLILRKTYGWHKSKDWISNSQFVNATGIKKQSVNRALKKLIAKNIVSKKAYESRQFYGLNEDLRRWKPSAKKLTKNVSNKASGSKPKSFSDVSNNAAHKSIITKASITKEKEFEKTFGKNPEEFIRRV